MEGVDGQVFRLENECEDVKINTPLNILYKERRKTPLTGFSLKFHDGWDVVERVDGQVLRLGYDGDS